MDTQKWIVGGIVTAIVIFIYQFVVHMFVLGSHYQTVAQFMRPEGEIGMATFLVWAFIADLVLTLGLGYIFLKGYEGKGVIEGLRFGLLVGLVFGFYFQLYHWLVFPGPFMASFYQMLVTLVEFTLVGIVFASMYKPKQASA